jgi:hypothetical protein
LLANLILRAEPLLAVSEAHSEPAPKGPRPKTSEKVFRDRLIGAFKKASVRELGAILKDPQLEPHMTLFLLLAAAFVVGLSIWVLEPIFV